MISSATSSRTPPSGRMSRPIASACSSVLTLPPRLAGITPCRITKNRSRVMPISRTRMTTVTHHGSSSSSDSPISAAPISALSAIGSAILPKSVTSPRLRASSPSTRSVTEASDEDREGAATRHAVSSPSSWNSDDEEDRHEHQPQHRQRVGDVPRARRAARGASGGSRPGSTSATRSTPSLADHRGGDDLPDATARRRRAAGCCRRPPGPGARPGPRQSPASASTSSTSTSTVSPIRSSARWATQLLGQPGDALDALVHDVLGRACRAAWPPRCRPRRSSRRRRPRRAGPRPGTARARRGRPRSRRGSRR